MWTIKEVKERGRESFKSNYWRCVLVAFIIALLSGGGVAFNTGVPGSTGAGFTGSSYNSSDDSYEHYTDDYRPEKPDRPERGEAPDMDFEFGPEFEFDGDYDYDDSYDYDYDYDFDDEDYGSGIYYDIDGLDDVQDALNDISRSARDEIPAAAIAIGVFVFLIVFIVIFAIAMTLSVFIINPIIVGGDRFFVKNLDEKAVVSNFAYAFDHNYKNIALTMFLKDLYTFLWGLLFIIPGIVKSYEYRMIPYLLADDPTMTKEQAFAISKQLMTGNKWKAFLLDLSFIGWHILSVLTLGILAIFYVEPYVYATNAALYRKLLMNRSDDFNGYYDPNAPQGAGADYTQPAATDTYTAADTSAADQITADTQNSDE